MQVCSGCEWQGSEEFQSRPQKLSVSMNSTPSSRFPSGLYREYLTRAFARFPVSRRTMTTMLSDEARWRQRTPAPQRLTISVSVSSSHIGRCCSFRNQIGMIVTFRLLRRGHKTPGSTPLGESVIDHLLSARVCFARA